MDIREAINVNTQDWIQSSVNKLKKSEPDDLIDAWETGVKRGMSITEKVVRDVFDKLLRDAIGNAYTFFVKLREELKVSCDTFFIRFSGGPGEFEILYLIKLDDYLSDKLKNVYIEANKLKAESLKENCRIQIIFKAKTSNTKIENIVADGFILHYAPKSR